MRRVDRLLLKVQEAQRLDAMQVSVCFVQPAGDKWQAIVDLWDGEEYPKGHTERLILEADTEEDAVAAIAEVEAAHAPTGYRAKTTESVIIINALPNESDRSGGFYAPAPPLLYRQKSKRNILLRDRNIPLRKRNIPLRKRNILLRENIFFDTRKTQ